MEESNKHTIVRNKKTQPSDITIIKHRHRQTRDTDTPTTRHTHAPSDIPSDTHIPSNNSQQHQPNIRSNEEGRTGH